MATAIAGRDMELLAFLAVLKANKKGNPIVGKNDEEEVMRANVI